MMLHVTCYTTTLDIYIYNIYVSDQSVWTARSTIVILRIEKISIWHLIVLSAIQAIDLQTSGIYSEPCHDVKIAEHGN